MTQLKVAYSRQSKQYTLVKEILMHLQQHRHKSGILNEVTQKK